MYVMLMFLLELCLGLTGCTTTYPCCCYVVLHYLDRLGHIVTALQRWRQLRKSKIPGTGTEEDQQQ